jgi:hypothetical protein
MVLARIYTLPGPTEKLHMDWIIIALRLMLSLAYSVYIRRGANACLKLTFPCYALPIHVFPLCHDTLRMEEENGS